MTLVPITLEGLVCKTGRIRLRSGKTVHVEAGTCLVEWQGDLVEVPAVLEHHDQEKALPVRRENAGRDRTGRRLPLQDEDFVRKKLKPFRGQEVNAEMMRAHLRHTTARFARMLLESAVKFNLAARVEKSFPEKFTVSEF